jgi:arabinoxylan arabinofuranohydrolase
MLILATLWPGRLYSSDSLNYIVNGDFEADSLNWRLVTGNNGSEVVWGLECTSPLSGERSARLVITGTGINSFDSQFNSYFTVHKDRAIVLSFEVRANDSSFFNFEVCRNYPPYTALYRSMDQQSGIPVGKEKSVFEYEITPPESDANFRFGFLLGNLDAGDTIWLDNVEIRQKNTAWDGNIIPNPEFDEYRDPDPDFPAYRKKRLYWGTNPNNEGGWEGGFCFAAPTNMVFDIDTTGKLSGENSAHIIINQKTGTDFFNGAYTVFFQASQGKAYELSFEAVATGNVPLSVAMNRQPFSNLEGETGNVGPPYYTYMPDRFFLDFTMTAEKKTYTITTSELTLSQGMHQVFFANFPEGSSEFWIDNVRLREIPDPNQPGPGDSITPGYSGNPIIRHIFTADPCAMVHDDTLYLFTGHDEQNTVNEWFYMRDWHVFSTTDMINYTDHGAKLSYSDFSWASGNAFAGHCIYNHGKFWWYVPMTHKTAKVNEGFAIGVAVSDRPTGPYTDAIGQALITDYTPNSVPLNIDPAVFIDDDGQVYMFWGSWSACRMVKLKDNMIELDGQVQTVSTSNYFEAPWVHKRNGIYYLTYASRYPSVIAYATSNSIYGPWTYRGILNDYVENSETNHPSIVKYKWNWYFFYHNGALPTGGNWRRSVCVDQLYYNEDGTMQKIIQTSSGVPELPVGIETTKAGIGGLTRIYPNPMEGNSLNIELPAGFDGFGAEISIRDLGGRLLQRQQVYGSGVIQIGTSLEPGSYIVSVAVGNLFHSTLLLVKGR